VVQPETEVSHTIILQPEVQQLLPPPLISVKSLQPLKPVFEAHPIIQTITIDRITKTPLPFATHIVFCILNRILSGDNFFLILVFPYFLLCKK
jgi:hypothetical protein